jgi:xylulokinase
MSITAGLDVGTQSTKLVCYDSDARRVVAKAAATYVLVSRDDGSREQEASWFVDAVRGCFSQIPADIRSKIRAIGVSGQQHGFVPLDKDGNVLAPVKLWCDTSTAMECAQLTERLGGSDAVFELIGNQILPGYTAGKVVAMKNRNPERYARIAHILLPHDYVNYYLTGRYVMEAGDASGTAFFDIRTRTWSRPVLEAIDPDADWSSLLPDIVPSSSVIGTVTAKAARELGLDRSVVVSAGGGDNMMGAIGTGCVAAGRMTVSMGTSGTLFGYSDTPIADPSGRLAGFCSSTGGWLPLLCTMNCTVATEEVRKLFDMDVVALDSLAADEPIGARGVTMLPYFNGERSPNYPNGKAVLAGFMLDTMTKGTIARAALESAVYSLRYGLDSFVGLGFTPTAIVLTGGGANSPIWRQMVSDVFDLPVTIPVIGESAAFGAAIQALWASGSEGDDLSVIAYDHIRMDEQKACMPREGVSAAYKESYLRFLRYSDVLSPIFS